MVWCNTASYRQALFFGFNYHFTKKNNDLYIGLQPGLSLTKLNETENNLTQSQFGVNPLFSSLIGYNYYVTKFFHFFIQSRLVIGQNNYTIQKNLSEIRFSAGLGFNINSLKEK